MSIFDTIFGLFGTKKKPSSASKTRDPDLPSDHHYPDVSQERLESINNNIRLFHQEAQASGQSIKMGREGVEYLDSMLTQQREEANESYNKVFSVIQGQYLGGCIIAQYGGRWIWDEVGPGVEILPKFIVFPHSLIQNQLANGSEDSVLSAFDQLVHAKAILAAAGQS